MKVLFIGGTGNISTSVSRLALERGIELYLLNRGQRAVEMPGAHTLTGDIRQPDQVQQAIKGMSFDTVVDWIAFGASDIESLWQYFARRSAEREGRTVPQLSNGAMKLLQSYGWPGNVRELENLADRIAILASGDLVSAGELQTWLGASPAQFQTPVVTGETTMPLAEIERRAIEKTLEQFDGHRQKTAEALGIGVRTLGMKLKKWRTENEQLVTL